MRVRHSGDWEAWLAFFLEGVRVTAESAVDTARHLSQMFAADRAAIERLPRAGSVVRVYDALKAKPIVSLSDVSRRTGISFPTASSAMKRLVGQGVAREITGKLNNRLFAYSQYLAILDEE